MDERQTQIRERAGLEESRLNLEFIDWLRKWGTPILIVAAVLAVGHTLRDRYMRSQAEKTDRAFQEFEAIIAGGNSSPEALLAVARDYSGVASVPLLAKLEAADAYMDSVRKGIVPGAEVSPDGTLTSADGLLSKEQRDSYLGSALDLYTEVAAAAKGNASLVLVELGATYGQAAVAECREQWDVAKAGYEKALALAEAAGFAQHVAVAKQRIAELDSLRTIPVLPSRADLPKPPAAPTDVQITPVDPAQVQPPAEPAPAAPSEPAPTDPAPTDPAQPK